MPAVPKPRPAALDREDRKRDRKTLDAAESAEVKQRSGGRCEVIVNRYDGNRLWRGAYRCLRRASEVHHMLGGWGVRARGRSALKEYKQHTCSACHKMITGHVLKLVNPDEAYWESRYDMAS